MSYSFHPEAEEELHEVYDYYECRQFGLGQRFAHEFNDALEQVLDSPLAWALLEAPYRLRKLKRFPYGILYECQGNSVVVVAVMHLHRRPGYLAQTIIVDSGGTRIAADGVVFRMRKVSVVNTKGLTRFLVRAAVDNG